MVSMMTCLSYASVCEIKQVSLGVLQVKCNGKPGQWDNYRFCQNNFDSTLQNLYKKYIGLNCTFPKRHSPYISRFYIPTNRFVRLVSIIFHLGMKPAKIFDFSFQHWIYLSHLYPQVFQEHFVPGVCPKKSCVLKLLRR